MKNIYLIACLMMSTMFIGCNVDQSDQEIKKNLKIENVDQFKEKIESLDLLGAIDLYYKSKPVIDKQDHSEKQMFYTISFIKLMNKGLAELPDSKIKLQVLDDQVQLRNNLPNIEIFFDLLLSCDNSLNKGEIEKIQSDFVTKNLKLIEDLNWPSEQKKMLKQEKLLSASKNFSKEFMELQ